MGTRLYAQLNNEFGTPVSGQALLDLGAPKRAALRSQFLLPGALNAQALQASQKLPALQVVIAGAGFAGLAAAWYLHSCGVSVAVFESNARIGGRVQTDRSFIAGHTVEAGAELIGANHPMWFDVADTFGLPLIELTEEKDTTDRQVRVRLGDHDLTPSEKQQAYQEIQQIIDAIGLDARDIDQINPWLSPGAAAFDAMSVQAKLDALPPPADTNGRALFKFMVENDNCAELKDQSYLGLLAAVSAGRMGDDTKGLRGYWDYTETHRCGGGNDQLATMFANPIQDQIMLNTAITGIDVKDDRVNFTDESGSGRADYFVLSAAPAMWPQITADTPFDPAQRTMSHGPAVKYLNSFQTQFWADSQLAPVAKWDRLGSVWESTDMQPTQPEFGLSVYAGGPVVLDETQYPQLLSAIYPNYAPTKAQFADWPHTPGVMTGYSVPSPGQVTTVGQALAEPFGRLYFAGEQSYVTFFGYMEGALRSGARAAREIIRIECPEAFQ
jgi:monoamine oxidase